MNKDTQLNKEFSKADVARLRNLITGKYTESTKVQVGYEKQQTVHVEGEVWEEDGKSWCIKDGVKQSISKLQVARESYKLPLFCPSCNKLMQHKYDANDYKIHKQCMNCQIAVETKMKGEGKWESYVEQHNNEYVDNLIKEYESWTSETLAAAADTFISEAGDVEKWSTGNNQALLKQKQEVLEYLKTLKK